MYLWVSPMKLEDVPGPLLYATIGKMKRTVFAPGQAQTTLFWDSYEEWENSPAPDPPGYTLAQLEAEYARRYGPGGVNQV
jgi:hypothetical protein